MELTRVISVFLAVMLAASVLIGCASSEKIFQQAQELFDAGSYSEALAILNTIPDHENASELSRLCQQNIDYQEAARLFEGGDYTAAQSIFESLTDFQDSAQKAVECQYAEVDALIAREKLKEAFELLGTIPDAPQIREQASGAWYRLAEAYIDNDQWYSADTVLASIPKTMLAEEMGLSLPSNQQQKINYLRLVTEGADDGQLFVSENFNSEDAKGAEKAAAIGDYKLAPIIAELLGAWETGDAQAFCEAFRRNREAMSPLLEMESLVSQVIRSVDFRDYNGVNAFLAIAPLYHEVHSLDINDANDIGLNLYMLTRSEMIFDNSVFSLSGENDQGKLLIFTSKISKRDNAAYKFNYAATAALPDSLRPSSLDEVGYILLIDEDQGGEVEYDNNYTLGYQKYVEITLYSVPDKRIVKEFGKVKGSPPPLKKFVIDVPQFVYGEDPDPAEIHAKYLDAVKYLESRAE